MGQEQEEVLEQASTYLAHVDKVTDGGNMLLSLTVEAYFMGKESSALSIDPDVANLLRKAGLQQRGSDSVFPG